MLFFTAAAQNAKPDYVALGMMAALVLLVVALALRKSLSAKKKETAPALVEAPQKPATLAPGSAGEIKLHDVEPRIAAMLMAIVANKMGKPLNELRFISIKEVK